jgi:hypothetical protein
MHKKIRYVPVNMICGGQGTASRYNTTMMMEYH